MVTGCAGLTRRDLPHILEFQTEVFLGFETLEFLAVAVRQVFLGIELEIENLLKRTEMLFWSAVTLKAPAHRKTLILVDHFHLIDTTVTAHTGNTAVHVSGVVEVDVVRGLVDAHPLDWLAEIGVIQRRIHTVAQRLELRAVLLHVLVTVPTSIRSRNIRMAGYIHKRVTVAAIKPELIRVDLVGKWNRLRWLVADRLGLRRTVPRKSRNRTCSERAGTDCDFEWENIGPARENVGHDGLRRSARRGQIGRL